MPRDLDAPLPAWHEHAACAGNPDPAYISDNPAHAATAAPVCARCPVTDHCRAWGREVKGWGVYGGQWLGAGRTEHERRGARRAETRRADLDTATP